MTDDLVRRAREALEGVTEGPWAVAKKGGDSTDYIIMTGLDRLMYHEERGEDCVGQINNLGRDDGEMFGPDARFIAAARQLVPEMADRIEALEVELKDARGAEAILAAAIEDGVRAGLEIARASAQVDRAEAQKNIEQFRREGWGGSAEQIWTGRFVASDTHMNNLRDFSLDPEVIAKAVRKVKNGIQGGAGE